MLPSDASTRKSSPDAISSRVFVRFCDFPLRASFGVQVALRNFGEACDGLVDRHVPNGPT